MSRWMIPFWCACWMAWQTWMNRSSRSLGGQVVLVAVVGDLDAPHQFHDEVGPAGLRGPGIQHLGDVGMVHQRQGLALGFEPGDDLLGVHAQLDDLEGDPAADGLLLLGHIDHPAAAFADLLEQFVVADAVAGFLGEGRDSAEMSDGGAGRMAGRVPS